ncbi:hypothetical protein CYMTET_54411 [Cymbomonas tetramitiformis]|uniref:Uncharacterized protein n=1 Tax=Cymbomonas tetramitiformis TaxID=36881 RepID=A0AAE0BG82_9CHLO|nr:hypothetical protein CYMTET_54411 [Cymbomonas tetramitiformis]
MHCAVYEYNAEQLGEHRELVVNLCDWESCKTSHSFKEKELIRADFDGIYYYGLVIGKAKKANLLVCIFEDGHIYFNFKVSELQVYTGVDEAAEKYSDGLKIAFNFTNFLGRFKGARKRYTLFQNHGKKQKVSGPQGSQDSEAENTDKLTGACELATVLPSEQLTVGSNKNDLPQIGMVIYFIVERKQILKAEIVAVNVCLKSCDPEWLTVKWIFDGTEHKGNLTTFKKAASKKLSQEDFKAAVRTNLYNSFKVVYGPGEESISLKALASRLYPVTKQKAKNPAAAKTKKDEEDSETEMDEVDPETLTKNTYLIVLAPMPPDDHAFTVLLEKGPSRHLHLVRCKSNYDPASNKVLFQYLKPLDGTYRYRNSHLISTDAAHKQGFKFRGIEDWMEFHEAEIMLVWEPTQPSDENSIPKNMMSLLKKRVKHVPEAESEQEEDEAAGVSETANAAD